MRIPNTVRVVVYHVSEQYDSHQILRLYARSHEAYEVHYSVEHGMR